MAETIVGRTPPRNLQTHNRKCKQQTHLCFFEIGLSSSAGSSVSISCKNHHGTILNWNTQNTGRNTTVRLMTWRSEEQGLTLSRAGGLIIDPSSRLSKAGGSPTCMGNGIAERPSITWCLATYRKPCTSTTRQKTSSPALLGVALGSPHFPACCD